MLAYLFWHRPRPAISRDAYEQTLLEFHRSLASTGVETAVFRLEQLPFAPRPDTRTGTSSRIGARSACWAAPQSAVCTPRGTTPWPSSPGRAGRVSTRSFEACHARRWGSGGCRSHRGRAWRCCWSGSMRRAPGVDSSFSAPPPRSASPRSPQPIACACGQGDASHGPWRDTRAGRTRAAAEVQGLRADTDIPAALPPAGLRGGCGGADRVGGRRGTEPRPSCPRRAADPAPGPPSRTRPPSRPHSRPPEVGSHGPGAGSQRHGAHVGAAGDLRRRTLPGSAPRARRG
jgi:hypothetical protein